MSEAELALGTVNAKALVSVIADIEAHENAEDMMDFMDGIAKAKDGDTLEIALRSNYRAQLVPVGMRFQRTDSGQVIWSSVERLKVIVTLPRDPGPGAYSIKPPL
ncbi:MAG: hypothetical protein AAF293_00980 [Pseudomonadota bacterium]